MSRLVILAVSILALGSVVYGQTSPPCIDTYFDDFNDGVLDPDTVIWNPCATVSEVAGRLELYTPPSCPTAGYQLNPAMRVLCGDFDAQIDFDLVAFAQPTNGARWVSFRVHLVGGGHVATVERVRNSSSSSCTFSSNSYYKSYTSSSADCSSTIRPTSHMSGRFRITRRGNIIATYYWEPSAANWVIMRQETASTADLRIEVAMSRTGSNPLATPQLVAFDNLSIRQGRDTDDDGWFDHEDNCLFSSNADQADSNNNGVGNACEWPPFIDLAQVRFQVTPLEPIFAMSCASGRPGYVQGTPGNRPLAYPYALLAAEKPTGNCTHVRGYVYDLSQLVPDPLAGQNGIPSTSKVHPIVRFVDLPDSAQSSNQRFSAINAQGYAVGQGLGSPNWAGMWLPDGTRVNLTGGSATTISDTGWMGGGFQGAVHVRWLPGNPAGISLPAPQSGGTVIQSEINDYGQSVGSHRGPLLRWRPDGTYEVLARPSGVSPTSTQFDSITAINNRNMAAGQVRDGVDRAVRWAPDGTPLLLPVPSGSWHASAVDICEYGLVIGHADSMLIWDNHQSNPTFYTLNSRIASGGWNSNVNGNITIVHEIETDAEFIRILATVYYNTVNVYRTVLLTAANPFQPNKLPTVTSPATASVDCTPPGGTVVTLQTHVEDEDGDALTVQWLVNGDVVHTENVPSGGATTSADLTLVHTFPPGMHTVVVIVDDGGPEPVQSAAATVTITADDQKPSFSCPVIPIVHVGENCLAAVPDIASTVVASDDCSPAGSITVTQSPTAGTLIGPGEYQLILAATDGAGNTTTCGGRTITVIDATPPAITDYSQELYAVADAECSAVVPDFTVGVVAADNCSPSVQVSQSPEAGSTVLGVGGHDVMISVADDRGNVATVLAQLTVEDVTPPVITLNGDEAVTLECHEGEYYDSGAMALDACVGTAPVVTGGDLVDVGVAGMYTVTYDAVDSSGNAAETVTRTVIVMPQTPLADAGADQTVSEGAVVTLDASATTNILCGSPEYVWSQVGGTPVMLTDSNAIHPAFTAPQVPMGGETLTFQLVVYNGVKISEPAVVNIHVVNINKVPVAVAEDLCGPLAVAEAGVATLDGANSYDPDDDPLTYTWSQTAGIPVTLDLSNPAMPTFTTPLVGPGGELLSFELTVSDGEASASRSLVVCIVNLNHAPAADAGPAQTVAEGATVTLDANASVDQDGDTLLYSWMQVSGPTVTLAGDDTPTPSFTAPQVGTAGATLVFRVTVADGYGGIDTAEVTITVQDAAGPPECDLAQPSKGELWPPNHKLVPVTITAVTHGSNQAVSITILSVTQDEPINGLGDGDTAPDAVIQGSTVLLRAERAGGGNGRVYRITFVATDGSGGTCMGTVAVRVPHNKGKNTPPAIDDGQLYNSLGN